MWIWDKAGAMGTKGKGCVSGVDQGIGAISTARGPQTESQEEARARGHFKAGNDQVCLVPSANKLTSIY